MSLAFHDRESARSPSQTLLRFGSFLLACVLLALHWGRSIPPEMAYLCELFGLCGLAFYFCLEVSADQRARQELRESHKNVTLANERITQRLSAERKIAAITDSERVRCEQVAPPSGQLVGQ